VPKTRTAVTLRAVLFTDIVGSTELARELGDERWARLLAAHRNIVRAQLRADRGREVDTAGDGFFAVFEGPADAVRCAFLISQKIQEIGLDVRAGVHFGEVETSGKEVHGIVVHTGARVMAQAGAGEVVITQTVKDLVAGSRFELKERGSVDLKGIPGRWTLFDVVKVDDQLRPDSIESATVAMERRERASVKPRTIARRPWMVPAAIVVAFAIATLTFLEVRPKATYVPEPGTVARIEGGRFDRPIDVGSFPVSVAEGLGRVWVMDRGSQVYWVAESDRTTGSRGTNGAPTGVAIGHDAVWITGGFGTGARPDATVSRLDPASGQLTPAFTTPIGSQAIVFGAGFVWVANPNTSSVTRYDPVSRDTRTIPLPGGEDPRPDTIAFGDLDGGAIWVGDSLSSNIYRIDVTGAGAIRTYSIHGPPTAIAVGRDAIWITSQRTNDVFALDPRSGAVRTSVDVGAGGCIGPASIASGADGIWVGCSRSARVIRIDPASGLVTADLRVAVIPIALTTAQDGSVWVAMQPR
jgi:class 3 adenylate cyclase/streptogramin lyase